MHSRDLYEMNINTSLSYGLLECSPLPAVPPNQRPHKYGHALEIVYTWCLVVCRKGVKYQSWGRNSSRMGILNVLDLLFTPFPQFLPELGIKRPRVGKRDTSPNSEILKGGRLPDETGSRDTYLAIQLSRSRGSACV